MEREPEPEEPFPLKGYLIINAIAWSFAGMGLLLVRWWFANGSGLGAFFVILAGAFTLVSVFDAIYDRRLAATSPRLEAAEGSPEADELEADSIAEAKRQEPGARGQGPGARGQGQGKRSPRH
ncbi:MAG: hypothetical protein NTX50_03240 [Candidatus Sumerlaeota bacterium]|nr:hypothetical protein [Candidatus Sumerlaeota bacterium]